MKWLPWILLVLLAATFLYWVQGRSQAEGRSLPRPELFGASAAGDTKEPLSPQPARPAHAELESDLHRELIDEIRGLRQDLNDRDLGTRQALTTEDSSSALERLASAVEKLTQADRAIEKPLQLPSLGFDFSAAFETLAARYHGPLGRRALTSYHLETQQDILNEYGRPEYVEEAGRGVQWSYNHGAEDEEWSLSFVFLEGRVSSVSVNGL